MQLTDSLWSIKVYRSLRTERPKGNATPLAEAKGEVSPEAN